MSEEKLVFSRRLLVLGNLALLAWLLLAFACVFSYTLIYSFLYIVLGGILIYGILRRLGCGSCYQCQTCTSGFGRLAGAFFGKGFVKKASVGNRVVFVGVIYFLLLPLPAALAVLSMLRAFSVPNVAALFLVLVLGAYSLSTWYMRSTVRV